MARPEELTQPVYPPRGTYVKRLQQEARQLRVAARWCESAAQSLRRYTSDLEWLHRRKPLPEDIYYAIRDLKSEADTMEGRAENLRSLAKEMEDRARWMIFKGPPWYEVTPWYREIGPTMT